MMGLIWFVLDMTLSVNFQSGKAQLSAGLAGTRYNNDTDLMVRRVKIVNIMTATTHWLRVESARGVRQK